MTNNLGVATGYSRVTWWSYCKYVNSQMFRWIYV